jgi:hypothetical protein
MPPLDFQSFAVAPKCLSRNSSIESLEDMRKVMNHHSVHSSHILGLAQTIRSHPESALVKDKRQLEKSLL